jgi:RNA polymerase sigma factor (sigma-70 family)
MVLDDLHGSDVSRNTSHRDTTNNLTILMNEVNASPPNNPTLYEQNMSGEELYKQNMRWACGIAQKFFKRSWGSSEYNGRVLAAALRGMWLATRNWDRSKLHFKSWCYKRIIWELYEETGVRRKKANYVELRSEHVPYEESSGDFSCDKANFGGGAYADGDGEDFMMKMVVHDAIKKIKNDKTRDVIERYYRIKSAKKETFKDISKDYGVTTSRIEQIHQMGLKELKSILKKDRLIEGLDSSITEEALIGSWG